MSDRVSTGDVILRAQNLRKSFRMGDTQLDVLKDVSVEVRKGQTVSIMGASGAGKTTLLHVLGGLERPSGGKVFFNGDDLYRMTPRRRTELRAVRIGFVFQAYYLLPELDVRENVLLPALSRRGALRRMSALRARADDLLERVGLSDRRGHLPTELSGGEQQRVALARALMNDPDIVLSDEPTGNLDSKTGELVLEHLFGLIRERGHTLLMVTHNEGVAAQCERQLVLRDGHLAAEP